MVLEMATELHNTWRATALYLVARQRTEVPNEFPLSPYQGPHQYRRQYEAEVKAISLRGSNGGNFQYHFYGTGVYGLHS